LADRTTLDEIHCDVKLRSSSRVHDLAVIIVSTDQARWLPRCVSTLLDHADRLELDIVVVDNGARRESAPLVKREVPQARVVVCENRGYANANNVGAATCDAAWLLFLNPDTEVLDGSLATLVADVGWRARVGVAGVRQVDATGELTPTIRRFPTATRAFGDALGLERVPGRPGWLGEREVRPHRYERELETDWTIGSCMLVRRDAFTATGGFDERFFLYSEEVDLCLRIRRLGWKVVHMPRVTILHHGTSGRAADPVLASQNAWAQLQYARKNLPARTQPLYRGALLLRYGLRSLHGEPARAATSLLLGRRRPPFEPRDRPHRPAPPAVDDAAWQRLVGAFGHGPGVIGATGGSGTRVVARIVGQAGMFIGSDLNRSEDALDFAAFADRWLDRAAHDERPPELLAELRALVARQRAKADARPWGWKEPRSVYLVPLLAEELPGLRFLHLVRDGRDMAFSANQLQLGKHGEAVIGGSDEPDALRSITLWSVVNLRAADYGERVLGERYKRVRYEDLCNEPAAVAAEILRFFGLDGDAERIAAAEVRPPATLGRWRDADPSVTAELEARAAEALRRFGYQSSSE
jgi:GT2 family glycosyltransferase